MKHVSVTSIEDAEEKLRKAMLDSNVGALNELLSPDLLFTNHLGQIVTKADDLSMHESGVLKIDEITPLEMNIRIVRGIGVVNTKVRIIGSYEGARSDTEFRFTRMWIPDSNGNLQVLITHSSIVSN